MTTKLVLCPLSFDIRAYTVLCTQPCSHMNTHMHMHTERESGGGVNELSK